MFKKIAFLLILVLVCNMTLWGAEFMGEDDPRVMTILVIGVVGMSILMIWGLLSWVGIAQADSPDNGIRMVSMDNEELPSNSSFNKFLNILQHIEFGTTQNNDIYLGLRFRY